MEENKKGVAQEVPVQEQPQFTVKIEITNLNEFTNLITQIQDKLKELKDFKLQVISKE